MNRPQHRRRDGAHARPDPPRERDAADEADEPRDLGEAGVAAEELVAAEPGERDLQPGLRRRPADEVAVDPVERRLVHRREEGVERGVEVGAVDPDRVVLRAVVGRDGLRERDLVVGRAPVLLESERDGAEPPADLGRERGERRRVPTGREEHAHVHVGDEVVPHAVQERRP